MKKKLNLTKLNEMSEKELKNVKGGVWVTIGSPHCNCGCYWAGTPGGSSSANNDSANQTYGLSSIQRW